MKNIILILLIFTTACDAIRPDAENSEQPDPRQLLLEINDSRRFISTDQLADQLINKDPSLLLVDVRDPEAFNRFALPKAVNIPLKNLLTENAQTQLECGKYTIVFYSNDDIYADQAWVLQREKGCQQIHVLKGGLNEWTKTIIQPEEPLQTADSEEWDLFRFRTAARKYFTGGATELEQLPYLPPIYKTARPAPLKTIVPKKKEVVEEEEEGC